MWLTSRSTVTPPDAPTTPCPACGSPLAGDQRYCLQCGERRGDPRVDYASTWVAAGTGAEAAAEDPAPARGLRGRLERLPRAVGPIAAAVMLLIGVAVGTVVSASTDSSDAATGAPAIVLGAGRTAAPTTTPAAAADTTDDTVDDTSTDAAAVTPGPVAATPTVAATATTTGTTTTDTSGDSGDDDLGDTGDDGSGDTTDTITNVWVITLAGRTDWFGTASPAPYLATNLAAEGTVLSGYTPLATGSVPGGVALLSGQAPTTATRQDCPTFADVTPATVASGLASGEGCVYPKAVRTLADQVTKGGGTWKDYVEGQGLATPCRHPTVGTADPARDPAADSGYLTARNPFVYFHSTIDAAGCEANVVDESTFATDIAHDGTVPTFSWIVPNAHHDGRDQAPTGGPTAADAFLKAVVPKITATSAYKDGGLILIVPDGPAATTLAAPTPATPAATGALVLSPFVHQDATVTETTGPYALLRTIEDRLDYAPLGHAADTDVSPLSDDVFTTPTTSDLR
jgi:hypothetical protein